MAVEGSVRGRRRIGIPVVAIGPLGGGISLVRIADAVALSGGAVLIGSHPLGTLLCLSIFVGLGLATPPSLSGDVGEELARLLACVATPTLVALPLADRWGELDRLAGALPLLAGAVVLERGTAYWLVKRWRSRGAGGEKTLVVGEGRVATSLTQVLQRHPEYGLRPIGVLGTDGSGLQTPLLGRADELEEVVRSYSVRHVVVAFGTTPEPELVRIVRACDDLPVAVYVVPRFFELSAVPRSRDVERVWGFPLVRLSRLAHRRAGRAAKRLLDAVVATIALVALSPLLAAAAVAVKLSSPGPVLFRQERMGRGGRTFEILKFRTMHVHEGADTTWFVSHDDQVTRVGHILRRTSIDELPQLVNVLRGEMSLVGPRPERPHYVERFVGWVPSYEARHRVLGGITGLAQIHGRERSLDSIPERARFDNEYIESWSLWRDVLILARTVRHVFRGDAGRVETTGETASDPGG